MAGGVVGDGEEAGRKGEVRGLVWVFYSFLWGVGGCWWWFGGRCGFGMLWVMKEGRGNAHDFCFVYDAVRAFAAPG